MPFAALSLGLVFCIYLFTPQPLEWHLRGSVDRLLFQLWPSLLFATSLLWQPRTSRRGLATGGADRI